MRRSVDVGEVLAGRYRVDSVLGQGSLGLVVAATHLADGSRVAIKLLVGEELEPTDHVRFVQEATIAKRLRGEHTVRVLEVGTLPDGTSFLVMELMEGEDLQHVIDREGPQPFENVMSWMLDACEALAEAHACGIIHRDVKPANLFLVRGGTRGRMLKIVDFGLSKLDADSPDRKKLTESWVVFGSPAYMAPEQFVSSASVDARADIFSLGATLYELVCGKVPFNGASTVEVSAQVMRDPPTPMRNHRPDIPRGIESIVYRCLQKKPADRFQTIRDLEAALVAALVDPHEAPKTIMMTHAPGSSPNVSASGSREEGVRRWSLVALVVTIVLATASLIYALVSRL
jgi:eukaryotic-like serine/threonine-protein kinase